MAESLNFPVKARDFPPIDWRNSTPAELLHRIEVAGIVGMGGAGFPTHKKLKVGLDAEIRMVIGNGVETDPGVTADKTLLKEFGSDVIEGMQIVAHILDTKQQLLAVASPELLINLNDRSESGIKVCLVDNQYQNGEERKLVELLTGKMIPKHDYPAELGIVVLNVATLFTVCKAVRDGIKPTHRVATILGKDSWIPFGSVLQEICDSQRPLRIGSYANGRIARTNEALLQTDNAVSIDKSKESLACIHCGWCTNVCPLNLPVENLYRESVREEVAFSSRDHLEQCNECGACVEACPSRIHVIDFLRESREAHRRNHRLRLSAEQAKQRFDDKQRRLQQELNQHQIERERRMHHDHTWQ